MDLIRQEKGVKDCKIYYREHKSDSCDIKSAENNTMEYKNQGFESVKLHTNKCFLVLLNSSVPKFRTQLSEALLIDIILLVLSVDEPELGAGPI